MTLQQADFYIINANDVEARLRFACRLTETILAQGKALHIHTETQQEAQWLDELLWSFKPESFIPHVIIPDPKSNEAPVHISYTACLPHTSDVLLNLAKDLPECAQQFERLTEIATDDPKYLQPMRQHYAHLKSMGIPLNTHDMRKTNRPKGR